MNAQSGYNRTSYSGYEDGPQVQPNGLPVYAGNVPLPITIAEHLAHAVTDQGYSAFAAELQFHNQANLPMVTTPAKKSIGPGWWGRIIGAVIGYRAPANKVVSSDSGNGGAPGFGSSPASGAPSFYVAQNPGFVSTPQTPSRTNSR
jgi:hypothetical protein